MELPPRGEPFFVLYDPAAEKESAAPAAAFAAQFSPSATLVTCDDESFWATVAADPNPPRTRLWRPGPLAETIVKDSTLFLGRASSGSIRLLDAGCGTGRNAVFITQEAPAVACVCLDNRQVLVDKCARFAARVGIHPPRLEVICAESEAWFMSRLHRMNSLIGCIRQADESNVDTAAAAPATGTDSASTRLSSTPEHESSSLRCRPRKGRVRLGADSAAVLAAADPRAFDIIMFARFTHKPSILLAAQVLYNQASAFSDIVTRPSCNGRLPVHSLLLTLNLQVSQGHLDSCLLAVESFHTTTPHPASRDQTLDEGELFRYVCSEPSPSIISSSFRESETSDSKDLPSIFCRDRELLPACAGQPCEPIWESLFEARIPCEDGRPLLQVILRCRRRISRILESE